jgi:hypothetical protein
VRLSSFESLAVRMASCCIVGRDAPILRERLRLRSSEDTTSRRAIVLTVSPAAAFYRASGFVLWHNADPAAGRTNVRY